MVDEYYVVLVEYVVIVVVEFVDGCVVLVV